MKRKRRQRVMSILMAMLMIVGLIPTDFAVTTAKAADVTVTTTEQDLSNGLKTISTGTAVGNVNITGTSMVINETAGTGGYASAGASNITYVYIPVTGITGDFKIAADVTVNKLYTVSPNTAPGTTQGVFVGITDAIGGTTTSPFVSVAMRGDYKYNMYRQKADGTSGGSASTNLFTEGTKSTLGIERRTAESKYYTTVDAVDLKNSKDINASLNADSYSGYVYIAVNGADVTIENLKIVNGDATVVYDQATYVAPIVEQTITTTDQDLSNGLDAISIGSAAATVKVTGSTMTIKETAGTGGYASAGASNTAYVYIPVTGLTGDYKVTADVTVNSLAIISPATAPGTTQGVFVGVTDAIGGASTSPFVSVAMRGDYKYNMYRQKADGTSGGSASTNLFTEGTKSTLGIERRTSESKYYTTVDAVDLKNSKDINASLNADSYSGYVYIAVNGADVTIENLKIVNGDATVVYDQAANVAPGTGDKATISTVTATLTGGSTSINWNAIGGSGSETTVIEYSSDNGTKWESVGEVNQAVLTISQDMTNLSSGTYIYRVTGDGAAVASADSIVWVQQRKDWTTVVAPSATAVQSSADVNVTWTMDLGTDGADSLIVELLDSSNVVVDTKTISKTATAQTTGESILTVGSSGTYTVKLTATRENETDKIVASATTVNYALALQSPTVSSATGDGSGGVAFVWDAVNEANSYTISYKIAGSSDTTYQVATSGITSNSYKVTGLSIDTEYTFKVTAVRTTPAATKEATYNKKVTSTVERVWNTAYVGTQSGNNKALGEVTVNSDGSVYMYAPEGKLASSNDGFAFYYTEVKSAEENFVLKSTINVTEIKDNQSGFGLLVADTIGQLTNGVSDAAGINFYMAGVSKTEFIPEGGIKTTYSCGTSFRKVTGCTDPTGLDTSKRVLDQSKAFQTELDPTQVINTANIAAKTCQTTFTFTLTKDNNGYYATMEGVDGVIHSYDASKLLQQDGDKVYVGLAVSRGVKATFSDISFESRNPASDPELDPSSWDKEYTPQSLFVFAGGTTASSDYTYRYYGNWAGQVTLRDGNDNVLFTKYVEAGETITHNMQLVKGTTKLITTIEADPEKVVLKSYDPIVIEKSVSYKTYGNEGETIIVSPDGTSSGKGTEASPMDIYTAVKYAQPGQVIYLKNGTYNITSAVTIPYSVSGTASSMITLMAETAGQVILDGSQMPEFSGSILNIYGNYWKVYGLDICNSSDNTKGMGISGSNNIVEMCNIYDNGTTGLQISRSGGEPKEWWPSNNLIKNCTAYNNCDPLKNDADGFAAKLTVGEGNKFYGCIAYNNIDDGWDLYAKNEIGQGQIGAVVIENCIAYSNGFVPGIDGYGEGNGFKLGGEGVPGAHQLINSISYNNLGKGIASNNGPDCQVINCTSYNNNFLDGTGVVSKDSKSANIALTPLNGDKYNGTTNYVLKNTISIYTLAVGTKDAITVKGQDSLESDNNYLVNSAFKSLNKSGAEATIDWFDSFDVSVAPTRDANGTINMHGLLVLKPAYAAMGIGAVIVTEGSDAVSVAPVKTTVITGDTTHLYLFFTLSIMSGAALVGLYFFDKKKKAFVR